MRFPPSRTMDIHPILPAVPADAGQAPDPAALASFAPSDPAAPAARRDPHDGVAPARAVRTTPHLTRLAPPRVGAARWRGPAPR